MCFYPGILSTAGNKIGMGKTILRYRKNDKASKTSDRFDNVEKIETEKETQILGNHVKKKKIKKPGLTGFLRIAYTSSTK